MQEYNSGCALAAGDRVGVEVFWSGDTPPEGAFLENGAAISRATYSALFARIGTMYGAGDGSTTFNLPDARGRAIRVMDGTKGLDPEANTRTDRGDGVTGDRPGTNQDHQFASHSHNIPSRSHNGDACYTDPRPTTANPSAGTQCNDYISAITGGTETRMINTNRNMIIYYK